MDKIIYELIDKDIISLDKTFITSNQVNYIKELPIKLDFKKLISYHYLLNSINKLLFEKIKSIDHKYILGISNISKHITSTLSFMYNIPLLMVCNNLILYGDYNDYDKCIVICDSLISGKNISQYLRSISKNLVTVKDIVVIFDMNYKKTSTLLQYNIHSLFNLHYLIDLLNVGKMINHEKKRLLLEHLNSKENIKSIEYRNKLTNNNLLKMLYSIMLKKQTNLLFKCSLKNIKEIVKMVDIVGPYICILEISSLNITNFNTNYATALKKLASNHNFLIFNNINLSIFNKNMIWANITSINPINSINIIKDLRNNFNNIDETSLILDKTTQIRDSISIVSANKDVIIGTYSSNKLNDDSILYFNDQLITPQIDVNKLIMSNCDIYSIDGVSISKNLTDFIKTFKKKIWSFY